MRAATSSKEQIALRNTAKVMRALTDAMISWVVIDRIEDQRARIRMFKTADVKRRTQNYLYLKLSANLGFSWSWQVMLSNPERNILLLGESFCAVPTDERQSFFLFHVVGLAPPPPPFRPLKNVVNGLFPPNHTLAHNFHFYSFNAKITVCLFVFVFFNLRKERELGMAQRPGGAERYHERKVVTCGMACGIYISCVRICFFFLCG